LKDTDYSAHIIGTVALGRKVRMALSRRLLNLTTDDLDTLANEPLITTPPEEKKMALAEPNGNSDYDDQDKYPKFDAALSRIYRYSPVPTLILDDGLCIVEVSDSHCTFSGQAKDLLMGTCVCDVSAHTIPAPDTPTLYGALRAAIISKEVQVIDAIHVKSKESTYQLRLTPIFEKSSLIYVVLETQNTSRGHWTATNEQHAYVNETYKILVDTIQDYAIFMLDTQGKITTWNPSAAKLKGYSPSEIIGKHLSVFYSPEDRRIDRPGRGLALALQEGRMEDEGWRYRQDGSRFWADVMITPIYQFGRHVGFVKVTRDLTERKAAETRMVAGFEESSKMKTNFLANMSHEIRTPMNGMLLALTMLKDTDLAGQQLEYTSIIEDSTSILLQITNDVLDYSKLSSGSFSLNSDVVDIKSVLSAVMRNCKPLLRPGVEMSCSIPPNLSGAMRGDPLRYRQVVQNLLGNAVKFTESGFIRLSTTFSFDEMDPRTYLLTTELADSGVGVPECALNTLFTPFTRFADSAARKYQGTGLGLSICKSLAELMDGTVGYRPARKGKGSVFWFTARLGRVDIACSNRKPTTSSSHDSKDTMSKLREIAPRKRILLVEDNLVNHKVMLKLLQSLGFERVDAAWNGAEAVQIIRLTPFSYDAVLMDINMPVLDGLEATSQIRGMGADVPIVALTANALKGDMEMYLAKGMDDFLGKPVNRDQLLRALWKWTGS
jgi:osomolarity two-component system sensor histidine kinase TcsA